MLTLGTAVELLSQYIGANKEPKVQINLVCEYFLKCGDPVGSLERTTFIVTADANGEGFITLPERYEAIRGAVEKQSDAAVCGFPLTIRNDWYEYTPGNLGMIKGSDPLRGIIPIQISPVSNEEPDTTVTPRKFKVPVCPVQGEQSFFTAICKRAFIFQTGDGDVLPVWNISALTYGLKALDKRDAEDFAREKELWDMGKTCLADEKENQVGPEALGKIQCDDDFCIGSLGSEFGYGWGGYGAYDY